jgi:hypothetical protein
MPSSGKLYIPPFAGVRLYECRDRITLLPVASFREFFGYGRAKASEAIIELEDGRAEPFWDDCGPEEEVWAVVQWTRYEDDHEEKGSVRYLRSPATEEDARKCMREMEGFYRMSKKELLALRGCFEGTEEDDDYIERRYPNYQHQPVDRESNEYKLYQARLKVLACVQPETVGLMLKADAAKDETERRKLQHDAIQAYFAEVASYWPEDMLTAWQRTNPVGTKWLCEFVRVMHEPERQLDPINHELALNWFRRGYNLLTENELSDAILMATGQRLMPGTLKKRRQRLDLPARPQGPRPNSER